MTDFTKVTFRVSRKRHRCDECGGFIETGDRYEHSFTVWDGNTLAFKTCQDCASSRNWMTDETDWRQIMKYGGVGGEGALFYYGELREHLLEQAREGHPRYRLRAYRLVVLMDRRHGAAKVSA